MFLHRPSLLLQFFHGYCMSQVQGTREHRHTIHMRVSGKSQRFVVETARRECALLARLASANRRRNVYRHHLFFRRSCHAVQLTRKCYSATNQNLQRREKRMSAALLSAHRALVKAVEHCTAELAANRIDTIALCVAFIGILSRLGCCVGETILLNDGEALLSSSYPDSYVTYVKDSVHQHASLSSSAPSRPATSCAAPPVNPREGHTRTSYGDIVNRLVKQAPRVGRA
ncbi:hypothetical protein JKF63_04198 [Porcisia hertigi]|uniref:Uncharacterized protein n=1 Tax=Porcisia hertigi TaxID=2761500 RepID=A0A836ISI8_9TRYP|nr:hypothetical protein JKF63_04198 [Porcisia hertigi]